MGVITNVRSIIQSMHAMWSESREWRTGQNNAYAVASHWKQSNLFFSQYALGEAVELVSRIESNPKNVEDLREAFGYAYQMLKFWEDCYSPEDDT